MDPQDMASQLRCPSGEAAAEVAQGMNAANAAINSRCIDALAIAPGEHVLEIGPGNGAFAANIVAAEGVRYTGLDWSADMVREAERLNGDLVAQQRAQFRQGSSEALPFDDACFDKVLAVHVLYFWEQPERHLAEIRRVMKPGGLLCMAFGERAFMAGLPFAAFGFALHGVDDVQAMLRACGFALRDASEHRERGRSNTGEMVDKRVHVLVGAARAAAG